MAKKTKSTPKEVTIEEHGYHTFTGNIGNPYFQDKAGNWILITKDTPPPKGAKILTAKPFLFDGDLVFDLTVYPTNGHPRMISVALFRDSRCWITGCAEHPDGGEVPHPKLSKGDLIRFNGRYRVKTVYDPKTGSSVEYHEVSLNSRDNLARIHRTEGKTTAIADLIASMA
jgi:hypothetical protein